MVLPVPRRGGKKNGALKYVAIVVVMFGAFIVPAILYQPTGGKETDNIDELKNLVEMKETVLKHTCALLRNVQVIGTSESAKEKEVQAIELERIEQNFKKRQLAVRTSNETKEIELRAEREAKRKQLM